MSVVLQHVGRPLEQGWQNGLGGDATWGDQLGTHLQMGQPESLCPLQHLHAGMALACGCDCDAANRWLAITLAMTVIIAPILEAI